MGSLIQALLANDKAHPLIAPVALPPLLPFHPDQIGSCLPSPVCDPHSSTPPYLLPLLLHHSHLPGICNSLSCTTRFCNGVHRRCLHCCGPRCLRYRLVGSVHLGVHLREGLLRPQEQHPLRLQGPDPELRPERQPRAVHAGVEPHGPDQVRDILVLAPSDRRPDRQAGGLHDPAEAHPLPRVRPERGRWCVAREQQEPRVLRWAVLDDVEAAHVRVHGLIAGVERDSGVQEGVPAMLRARVGLRQCEAGADLRLLGGSPQLNTHSIRRAYLSTDHVP